MRHPYRWIITTSIAFLSAALLNSCASTQMKTSWKDPSFPFGNIKTILVLGVSQQESERRFFEDQFTKDLRKYGVQGTSGYTVTPSGAMPDEATIKAFVKEHGVQAVLVTRVLDKKVVDRVVPPTTSTTMVNTQAPGTGYYNNNNNYPPAYYNNSYPPTYYGYYQTSQQYVTTTTPGYTVQETIASAETRVFDSATNRLIWAGTSETILNGNVEGLMKEYARLITSLIFKP